MATFVVAVTQSAAPLIDIKVESAGVREVACGGVEVRSINIDRRVE